MGQASCLWIWILWFWPEDWVCNLNLPLADYIYWIGQMHIAKVCSGSPCSISRWVGVTTICAIETVSRSAGSCTWRSAGTTFKILIEGNQVFIRKCLGRSWGKILFQIRTRIQISYSLPCTTWSEFWRGGEDGGCGERQDREGTVQPILKPEVLLNSECCQTTS